MRKNSYILPHGGVRLHPMDHTPHMRHALRLAQRALGQTWPNPAVGAVVLREGRVVGVGHTAPGGRPHAEPHALDMAENDARGATLYVSLEPCAHHGKTPPCTEAIIHSGVARVVVACRDPHPEVNGRGIAALRAAGIEVVEDVCRTEAEALNKGFFSVIARGRPHVAVKLATSANGVMVTPPASSHAPAERRWITGPEARAYGHMLRAEHDAILTGIGTVLVDNPALTCRLPGMEHRSPQRVVLDRSQRLPAHACIHPCWVYHTPIPEVLEDLAARGVTRVLVEAGPTLTQAFLEAGLADSVFWFQSPDMLEGAPAISPKALTHLHALPPLTLGRDVLKVFAPLRSSTPA